jgi:streptogramin lyase
MGALRPGVVASVAAIAAVTAQPHLATRIVTGTAPCESAATTKAVWVANDGAGTLVRIDPRTNRVTARVVLGRGACAVAAGAGAVWVVNYRTGMLARVDPVTRRSSIPSRVATARFKPCAGSARCG